MSGIRSIHRNAIVKGLASGASAPIYVNATDNKLKMIPAGSGTTEVEVIDASTVQTLTNKTLTSPTITGATLTAASLTVTDDTFSIADGEDATKIAQFDAGSISTGTTRTYVLPDANDTVVLLAASQAISGKTSYNKVAITAPATSATLTIADGKTLTANNSIVLAAGADSQTFTFPATTDTVVGLAATQTLTGKTLGSATLVNTGADVSTPGKISTGYTDFSANVSGSVQNTEYILNSVTIKANSFNANGRSVVVEAWGTTAANANAKNFKIYFGGTAIATVTGSTANNKDFYISLTIVRTNSNTQSAVGTIQIDTAVAPAMAVNGAVGETDTADIVISVKSANTAAAATSGTGKGMVASFQN